jgi:hypothetical protein
MLEHFNPEENSGIIESYGWYKVQRHTKTILVNILKNFFSNYNSSYKTQIPEIIDLQGDNSSSKINIERDFPFFERKLPLIAVVIQDTTEKKTYIGADDFANNVIQSLDGTSTGILYGHDSFHGMYTVATQFIVAAMSPEQRMQLAELISVCFTHYYRWQYFYFGPDDSMFTIVPNTKELKFGGESEVKEESAMNMIYITTANMENLIEYKFTEFSEDEKLYQITGIDVDSESGVVEL